MEPLTVALPKGRLLIRILYREPEISAARKDNHEYFQPVTNP